MLTLCSEDSGAFELVIRDLEVDLLLGLGMDADGQPSFRCAACGASVGSAGLNLIDARYTSSLQDRDRSQDPLN
jgi:hypothetical protein